MLNFPITVIHFPVFADPASARRRPASSGKKSAKKENRQVFIWIFNTLKIEIPQFCHNFACQPREPREPTGAEK